MYKLLTYLGFFLTLPILQVLRIVAQCLAHVIVLNVA